MKIRLVVVHHGTQLKIHRDILDNFSCEFLNARKIDLVKFRKNEYLINFMSKINFKKSTFSTFRTKMNEYFNIMK